MANGRLAATNELRLAIGVPLRDPAGLDDFLAQLADPASPNYRHFLTPEEFAERFGPTEADYEAVKEFAQTNGLTIVGTHPNRLLLDVTGPAAAVENALHITLRTYQHPTEARQFFAPDTEPTVDASLPVADIQGLSDFYRPHPRLKKMDVTKLHPDNGSAPDGSGSYFGNDFRNAYVPGTTLTGAGQMVGLLQFDGYYANDIAAYAAAAGGGRANIVIQKVLLDGYNGVPTTGANSGNDEVSLDIEMSMAMAPGLAKIMVFEAGPNGLQNDILNSMVTYSATVKQLSSSWGWGGGPSTTTDNIYKSMAAVGQSFFNASGDSGAFTTGAGSANGVDNTSLQNAPSSSPYITQVGGTTLTMNGTGASYSSETVWNWNVEFPGQGYDGVASSGGVSSYYSIPSWQTNVSDLVARGGSTGFRNIPDVALTADNVYTVSGGSGAGSGGTGGTSCAAPLWAGFMALVNQQAVINGNTKGLGLVNPAIYAIAAGSGYASCFHDVTTGNNTWSSSASLFYAGSGYDLCTGLGTPNGTSLITALAGTGDTLGISPGTGFASSGPVGGPFSPGSGTFLLTNSSAALLNWSLVVTSAWVSAAFTNGTLAAHTTTNLAVSLTAAAGSLALGNYSTNLRFSNQVTHVVQIFPFALQVTQPMSVAPVKGFTAVGPVGGAFAPNSQSYVLTNMGGSAVKWSLINTSTWLTASFTGGTLGARGQTNVSVSVSVAANNLAAGVYGANLVFSNASGAFAVVPFTLSVGQPVLQNGGFETGDFTGWTLNADATVNQVTGTSGLVHSGSYGAELGQSSANPLGYLYQTLTTIPGQSYVVSLWLDNPNNSVGATPNQFFVQWNGTTIYNVVNLPYTAWTNLQFLVTANSSSSVLQFGFYDAPYYLGLDDISVTPVTPPQFKLAQKSSASFNMTWGAVTGLVYQVQYCTNLMQPNWVNLGGPLTTTGSTLSVTDTNGVSAARQRFYRLQVTP